MKYLFIKMRRDISRMWVQFFSVFMMSVLAITIYSGMEGVWYGLKCEVDKYYEETNLADAWVNGYHITDDMVNDIARLDNIDAVEKSMTMTVGLHTSDGTKPDLKLMAMETTSLFTPIIIKGMEFDKDSEDGVWIDATMAEERDINIGDYITLTYGQLEKEFQVKGYFLHSEFIYYTGSITDTVPNHNNHGYGMIGEKAAQQFYGNVICNEIRLDIVEGSDFSLIQKEVEAILEAGYMNGYSDIENQIKIQAERIEKLEDELKVEQAKAKPNRVIVALKQKSMRAATMKIEQFKTEQEYLTSSEKACETDCPTSEYLPQKVIDKNILKRLKKYGVKTIELGVQSSSDYILKRAQREHTFEDVKKASKLIRKFGFTLGHQMMVGLPESTKNDELKTAKDLIKLKPKIVRIYPVLVINGTQLEKDYQAGEYVPLSVDQAVETSKDLLTIKPLISFSTYS